MYIRIVLCGLERANSWYEQKPEEVVESENFKILWDFTVQCDRNIEARRPDIVFIDKKEREGVVIDVAILGDDRVKDKELEKLEKYQLLKDKIAEVWRMQKVIVVLVVIGALEESRSRLSQVNNSPRANVFPAGMANFGEAMYRSLERSTLDTWDGFFFVQFPGLSFLAAS